MSKKAKDFKGLDIREVWDFRLSHGSPILFNSGEFWVIKVFANDPENEAWKDHPGREEFETPDGNVVRVVLEEIVTDIPTHGTTIQEGQQNCYPYLYEIRDKYSRSNIELRKPVVKLINDSNRKASELNAKADAVLADDGDEVTSRLIRAEASELIREANKAIKKASAEMRAAMAKEA